MHKLKAIAPFLFFLILFTAPLAVSSQFSAFSIPYWLKPGTYFEYYANATSRHSSGISAVYVRNGVSYYIQAQKVVVRFSVLNVSKGWAYIRVEVVFEGDKMLLPNSTAYIQIYYGQKYGMTPWIKSLNVTPKTLRGLPLNVIMIPPTKNLTVSGVYKVNLGTGEAYSLNGTCYGHTILWGWWSPPHVNESIVFYNGIHLKVKKVLVVNTTVITYAGKFHGPNVELYTSLAQVRAGILPAGGMSSFTLTYNPGNELTLSFSGIVPDLEAMGLETLEAMDNSVFRYEKTHKLVGKVLKSGHPPAEIWALGIVLKSTNAERTLLKTSAKPPSSRWFIWIIAGLSILGVVTGVIYTRRHRR